jgi:hypothetical protein
LAAEGKSRASSDAALPCSVGASISCAAREGETGPCPFTLDVLVSWPLLFIGGVLLRFAGLAPRVRRTFPGVPGSSVDSERFARSGELSIVVAVFTAGSFSGRYGELLSRPENHAIAGNSGELADELQDCFDKRLIRAKKRACTGAFERFCSVSQKRLLGVRVGLSQDRAPELTLGSNHLQVDPNGAVRFHGRYAKQTELAGRDVAGRFKCRAWRFGRYSGRDQTRSFAVRPLPPVEETNLMRRNLACTPFTVRASPAAFVVVSMV